MNTHHTFSNPHLHFLQKIYQLEENKNQCLKNLDFPTYQETCLEQQKMVILLRKSNHKDLHRQEKKLAKEMAQKIQRKIDTNQILLGDCKKIISYCLLPYVSTEYDNKGKVAIQNIKAFTTNV